MRDRALAPGCGSGVGRGTEERAEEVQRRPVGSRGAPQITAMYAAFRGDPYAPLRSSYRDRDGRPTPAGALAPAHPFLANGRRWREGDALWRSAAVGGRAPRSERTTTVWRSGAAASGAPRPAERRRLV